jgi:hypothetical protein
MRTEIHMQAHQDTNANVQAYNLAFEELGLDWHWDETRPAGPQAVREYLEREHAHLLRAYDADFLVRAIEEVRTRCMAGLAARDKP